MRELWAAHGTLGNEDTFSELQRRGQVGITFGQVRRAAARLRDAKAAIGTYGEEKPVWDAEQRMYVFPAAGVRAESREEKELREMLKSSQKRQRLT